MAEMDFLVRVRIDDKSSNQAREPGRLRAVAQGAITHAVSRFERIGAENPLLDEFEIQIGEIALIPDRAIITLSGGLIREVEGLPIRVTFEIHDYDVEVNDSELEQYPTFYDRDAEGRIYFIQEVRLSSRRDGRL